MYTAHIVIYLLAFQTVISSLYDNLACHTRLVVKVKELFQEMQKSTV